MSRARISGLECALRTADVADVKHSAQNPVQRPIAAQPEANGPHAGKPLAPAPKHTGPRTTAATVVAAPHHAGESADRLARLTHELANLLDGSLRNLNIVLGLGRAAPAALADTLPDIDKRLRSVHTALGQMATMVDNAARPGSTKASPREDSSRGAHADLTVADACEHAVTMLEPLAAAAGAEVRVLIDEPARLLPADILYTIVSNGLRNALESIASANEAYPGRVEAGRVDLRVAFEPPLGAESASGLLTVEIADNGIGLPVGAAEGGPVTSAPDMRGFSLGLTTKRRGHGIGLALCSELIAERGGTIRLKPGNSGVGATLRVRWPVSVLPTGHTPIDGPR